MPQDEVDPQPPAIQRPVGLRRLVAPHPSITSMEERRRARLSSVVTLVLLLIGIPYLAVSYLTTWFGARASILTPSAWTDVTAMAFIVLAYALSRTRHHQLGILLAAIMMDGAIIALWLSAGVHEAAILYYLVVGFIVSSGVLPFRTSLVFSGANLLVVVVLVAITHASDREHMPDYLYVMFFLVVCAVLLQAGGYMIQMDQRRLEERTRELALSEGRFRAMAENLPQAVFITEPDLSRTHYVSAGYSDIWGRPREPLYENPLAWLDGIRADDREKIMQRISSPSVGATETVFRVVRPDGSERTVRSRTFPIMGPDRRPILAAGISEDITAFEEAQRVLRESIERLRQTEEFRLRMIQTVAHDLQSPLTPIKIQAELLRGELGDSKETREAGLTIIDRNADHVSHLVNDLRDVARLEGGNLRLSRRRLDLAEIASQTMQTFLPIAQAKSIRLDLDAATGAFVDADPQRLAQVAYNLTSNALKFTPVGGRVTIRVAKEDAGIVLSVVDTGRGLSADEIPKLFQPFSQVHGPGETAERGTGLGLYISKGLAASHGGRVGVQSEGRGRGSTFWAWIPGA